MKKAELSIAIPKDDTLLTIVTIKICMSASCCFFYDIATAIFSVLIPLQTDNICSDATRVTIKFYKGSGQRPNDNETREDQETESTLSVTESNEETHPTSDVNKKKVREV